MRCRTAQQLISLYIAPRKSWLSPEDRHALEAHLAACEPCRRDCRESREAMGMVQQCWQISADTRALLENQRHGSSGRVIKLYPVSRRVAVRIGAAACLVVGLLAWRAIVEPPVRMTRPADPVASSAEGTPLSIGWAGDGGRIAPGTAVLTSATQIRTLVINNKHQLTLDAGTKLSIEPLAQAGAAGCLVRLAWGRICAQVEHDGHPFAVQTPHGRAVITGTTFDVKTTPAGTTLVVVEGSVRFESEAGAVQVAAGHCSRITAPSNPPSTPAPSDAAVIAWAGPGQRTAQVAGILPSDDLLLADLPSPLSQVEAQTDLDKIDYTRWVERKREWFRQQFPWVFRLKEALARDRIEVDYPELLIQSGEIWRFGYPPAGPGRQVEPDPNGLLKAASHHGRDESWLQRHVLTSLETTRDPATSPELTCRQETGTDAFECWAGRLLAPKTEDCSQKVGGGELLLSQCACWYLINTRTLMALTFRQKSPDISPEVRNRIQALLDEQFEALVDCLKLTCELTTESPCLNSGSRQERLSRLSTMIRKIGERAKQEEEMLTPIQQHWKGEDTR